MFKNHIILSCIVLTVSCCLWGAGQNSLISSAKIEIARSEDEFSFVYIEPARMNEQAGIAVIFEGTDDLHYYAKQKTAPGGYNLTIMAESNDVNFGQTAFPKWKIFSDPLGDNVEVYAGNFTVFIPIKKTKADLTGSSDIKVKITGITCTSKVCLRPFNWEGFIKINSRSGTSGTMKRLCTLQYKELADPA